MADVTDEQWAFVEEATSDFKANLRMLADQRNDNKVEQHLTYWAIYLGVFAIEAYESMTILIRADKLRSAFMLSRALMEYHVRLRYYLLQSDPLISGMRAHPNVHVDHFYRKAQAITDWKNADAKIADLLRHRLKNLSDEDRADVLKTVAENEALLERNFKQMLELVAKDDPDIWDISFPKFKMQSAFLHGDQAALTDAVRFEDNRLVVHFDSPAITGMQLLAEASWFMTEMFESFGRVYGWSYGGVRAKRRSVELFTPTLSAAVQAIEADQAARAAEKQAEGTA